MSMISRVGKFVYAWSVIGPDGSLYLPEQALQEYHLSLGPVILMSGRNTTGGFNVVCKELVPNSPLASIFSSLPQLTSFSIEEGSVIKFKERLFCWTRIRNDGTVQIPIPTLKLFGLKPGDKLLGMRTSHLSFSLLSQGPYVDRAISAYGIKVYQV